MMRRRRVLIINDGKLLSEGLLLLIQAQPNLELLAVDAADPELAGKVRESQADVIVVPAYEGSSELARVAHILRGTPGSRVISLGLDNTEINSYQFEGSSFASLEGLLSAIEGRTLER